MKISVSLVLVSMVVLGSLSATRVRAEGESKLGEQKSATTERTLQEMHDYAYYLALFDGFERRHGTAAVFEGAKKAEKTAAQQLDEWLAIFDACAYSRGDKCMVAGWLGEFSKTCRVPKVPEMLAQVGDSLVCNDAVEPGTAVICNPEIFGVPKKLRIINTSEDSESDNAEVTVSSPGRYCVPRTEPRMTLACMKKSLADAGVKVKSYPGLPGDKFSDADLLKWAKSLSQYRDGKTVANARDAAMKLCMDIGLPDTDKIGTDAFKAQKSSKLRDSDMEVCSQLHERLSRAALLFKNEAASDAAKMTDGKAKLDQAAVKGQTPAEKPPTGAAATSTH